TRCPHEKRPVRHRRVIFAHPPDGRMIVPAVLCVREKRVGARVRLPWRRPLSSRPWGYAVRPALPARRLLGICASIEGMNSRTLFPDNEATLEASKTLVKDGFVVLPYVNDDLIMAKKLRDAGCAAVMPLAAPIGSGLGIQNPSNLRLILEEIADLPVIVDAGVGTASDAAVAMEMGVDGVLMNTAIAGAGDPVLMARAMRLAIEA